MDLVVIARSFLEEASGPSLTGTHSGKIAVVLEEGDTLSQTSSSNGEGLIRASPPFRNSTLTTSPLQDVSRHTATAR